MANDRMTPEGWVDGFLASDRERRLRIAKSAIGTIGAAEACWFRDHEEQLRQANDQRGRTLAACQDVINNLDGFSEAARPALQTLAHRIASVYGSALWPAGG